MTRNLNLLDWPEVTLGRKWWKGKEKGRPLFSSKVVQGWTKMRTVTTSWTNTRNILNKGTRKYEASIPTQSIKLYLGNITKRIKAHAIERTTIITSRNVALTRQCTLRTSACALQIEDFLYAMVFDTLTLQKCWSVHHFRHQCITSNCCYLCLQYY